MSRPSGDHTGSASIQSPSVICRGSPPSAATTKTCGQTIWVIIRDRRTGASRRILLWRNVATSNNPVFSAVLSWAPDDRHLAVGISPAAAITSVTVINARRATDAASAPPIGPCAGRGDECLDPSFDARGRLTFLKGRNELTATPEWIMRWHGGRAVPLMRLSRNQRAGGTASIATDRAGNAVLLEGGLRHPEIWRWSGGHLRLVLRSTAHMLVVAPLWLSHG